ncbi:sigma-70 family RNA polymerase sigma factor [Halobacillus seohaensis]|uniref:Sigma-70 family RNA polymerase sigma factor n=1 Tax=Halobacillus seohaensis TaxID=447421 RepID=A0ABW2EJS7_9BACI
MNKKQVENLIYEYHWHRKELDRIGEIIWGGYSRGPSFGLVQQFGIEATMPKANTNIKSAAEIDALDVREKRLYKRWLEYREKVQAIELMVDFLEEEQQKIVLDCMMEGMSYRSIADHLSINRNKIREMKDDMLCQLCQKCHFLHDLLLEKITVKKGEYTVTVHSDLDQETEYSYEINGVPFEGTPDNTLLIN